VQVWVDADACPNTIKEILFRAATRTRVLMTLVANKPVRIAVSPHLRFLQVDAGFDAADKKILALLAAGDLVITADLPLAAAVIERNAVALNPRGELYTAENVRERLSMRNFMDELRGGGLVSGGPPPLDARNRQAFASQLDRLLAKAAAPPSA
jgi:uncharacterized protein YaiI (UPF0178 family)